ncbi:MAG TPA: FAD-dependent oxidoreductase, partial [Candidatus Latescibacteria bacterium]|nr:FAD-dependent oxidoreductase [Candidatus Latescibacterota bacterium]
LGNDFRSVARLTRILYKKKLFRYPINGADVVLKMGVGESLHALVSYARAKMVSSTEDAKTFEEWVSAQFGKKLYQTFFRTYTEKVWGIPCSEIGAEWAAQRIKGLDLLTVAKKALGLSRKNVKTLVDQFNYPTKGAGMMYTRMSEIVQERGHRLLLDTSVTRIVRDGDTVKALVVNNPTEGEIRIEADHFLTSMPITHFIRQIDPPAEPNVIDSAGMLYYRDHVTVNLVIDGADLFPDQWIYVHAPDVKMARLANYNNFSNEMPAKKNTTLVSVEYFTFQNDDVWGLSNSDLVALGTEEITRMGLIPKGSAQQGWVVRETESYPTYYMGYQQPFDTVRSALDRLTNCTPIGRGGMYKYNNMDHSLYTGLLAARNLLAKDGRKYDLWQVNIDAEYHEGAVVSGK